MIKYIERISGKTHFYAENERELVNSLFNTKDGTLEPLFKITKKQKTKLYWTNEKGGFYFYNDILGKFSKKDGKLFFQYNLDKATII